MNQKTGSKFLYMVLFWACPKSGFDVAKKNEAMKMFKEMIRNKYPSDPDIEGRLKSFEENNDGLVVFDEVVESDTRVIDPDTEIMPIIRKRYSEARCILISPMIFDS
jgi:hypothetical protein